MTNQAKVRTRPLGVTITTLMMCVTNALGFFLVNWAPFPKHHPRVLFSYFTALIIVGYIVLQRFWSGKNWVRWLVLLTSVLSLWNVWALRKPILPQYQTPVRIPMVLAEGVIAIFLLYYLNTRNVRSWFLGSGSVSD